MIKNDASCAGSLNTWQALVVCAEPSHQKMLMIQVMRSGLPLPLMTGVVRSHRMTQHTQGGSERWRKEKSDGWCLCIQHSK